MFVSNTESDRKSDDDYQHRNQSRDRAAHLIAEKFGLTVPLATTIARLAGLGEREAAR